MLAVVIVNYKSEDKTISYIKDEIIPKVKTSYVVIIVNNSANKESNNKLVKGLEAKLVDIANDEVYNERLVYIVPHSDNLGFAKGNNLGAEFAIKHFSIKYFLFTNNDIRLISNQVVEKLIDKLDTLTGVGVIGPRVLGLRGENQSPEPYKTIQDRHIWMYWLTPFLNNEAKRRRFKLDYPEEAKEGIHYKVMGSFFIVKATDFMECGMMDSNTFLYGEEVILSERLKTINKSVYYFPEVEILHEHSQTISNHLSRKKIALTQFESESYYYKKYKGVSSVTTLLAKISLLSYLALKGLRTK